MNNRNSRLEGWTDIQIKEEEEEEEEQSKKEWTYDIILGIEPGPSQIFMKSPSGLFCK